MSFKLSRHRRTSVSYLPFLNAAAMVGFIFTERGVRRRSGTGVFDVAEESEAAG